MDKIKNPFSPGTGPGLIKNGMVYSPFHGDMASTIRRIYAACELLQTSNV